MTEDESKLFSDLEYDLSEARKLLRLAFPFVAKHSGDLGLIQDVAAFLAEPDPVRRLENLMDALADHVEAMTDEQILADAKARGVDLVEQSKRVKAVLLDGLRKGREARDRLMASPVRFRGSPEGK